MQFGQCLDSLRLFARDKAMDRISVIFLFRTRYRRAAAGAY
jgi:hypothetical protein